jgi:hypothetical protein
VAPDDLTDCLVELQGCLSIKSPEPGLCVPCECPATFLPPEMMSDNYVNPVGESVSYDSSAATSSAPVVCECSSLPCEPSPGYSDHIEGCTLDLQRVSAQNTACSLEVAGLRAAVDETKSDCDARLASLRQILEGRSENLANTVGLMRTSLGEEESRRVETARQLEVCVSSRVALRQLLFGLVHAVCPQVTAPVINESSQDVVNDCTRGLNARERAHEECRWALFETQKRLETARTTLALERQRSFTIPSELELDSVSNNSMVATPDALNETARVLSMDSLINSPPFCRHLCDSVMNPSLLIALFGSVLTILAVLVTSSCMFYCKLRASRIVCRNMLSDMDMMRHELSYKAELIKVLQNQVWFVRSAEKQPRSVGVKTSIVNENANLS